MKQHEYQYPIVTEIPRKLNPVDRDTFIDEYKGTIMERNTQRLQSNPDVVLQLHHMSVETLVGIRANLGELAMKVSHDIGILDSAISQALPPEVPITPVE